MRRLTLAFGMALLFVGGRVANADPITLVATGTVDKRRHARTGARISCCDERPFHIQLHVGPSRFRLLSPT